MKKTSFWINDAQQALQDKIQRSLNEGKAKNVILFLGDGLSIETIAAGRILKGQLEDKLGERSKLTFENFPALGLSKTYCVDKQVADSACTSTAYLGGVKGNYGTIGVNGNVSLNDCASAKNPINHVESIASWAQKANKSSGLVTNTPVTHASPAGVYSHLANREFESDNKVKLEGHDPAKCLDAALQLVYNDAGKKLNVVLGGGTKRFLPNGTLDFYGNSGERLDGRNLIREWRHSKTGVAKSVFNLQQLLAIDFNNTDYLMGLFASEEMKFKTDADTIKEPSLERMTEAAIKILQKNDNGFFLFVEGGHIDTAHHENMAQKALIETLEFSKAIQKALDMTNSEETLIVVTADHSHTMTFSGYSDIGNNILGLNTERSDIDKLPYTTLSYANGPSYYKHFNWTGDRLDLSNVNVLDKEFQYVSTFPLKIESHGGEDVAVYANGPWSHLFTGSLEQNLIPHMMAYASCIGDGLTMCQKQKTKSSGTVLQVSVILIMLSFVITLFKNQ
ncbi:membrane-bound alkaline phosphatase-like [Episyrphus balteatus]|uniref:membrane-bound alkaline phosphatase-like n=1 Tax=Episyrphus balteatus TaxID=286459 RepID=UPI0024853AAE|nr:membrane-bound alkaline phosphatase-like [Episyrphus balteatus]